MLVLLVPTAIWVRLRLPGLRRLVEFICLLPLTIPASCGGGTRPGVRVVYFSAARR
jgi:hypothetical protein